MRNKCNIHFSNNCNNYNKNNSKNKNNYNNNNNDNKKDFISCLRQITKYNAGFWLKAITNIEQCFIQII